MPTAYRYALYFAPPSPWRDVGAAWLGRCAQTGATLPRPPQADPRESAWTSAPRHYGLHATLKPPFRLAVGATASALDAAVRQFAASQTPFEAVLDRRVLRGFLAWCLRNDEATTLRMNALAGAAVRALDAFRAPADEAELRRRQALSLGPAEQRMLAEWGYPYVFDCYTFHITLTNMLDTAELADADARLAALSGPALAAPMPVRAVAVYVQPAPEAPFVVARHYGFDGVTRDGAGACWLSEERAA